MLFREFLLIGFLILPAGARAEDAPVVSAPAAPVAVACPTSFAKLGTYNRVGSRFGRGIFRDVLRKALRQSPHAWTADEYDQLSQLKVTDIFPLDTKPGGQLSLTPNGLKSFNTFLGDYSEALYARLEQLDAADGGHYLGKARLAEFHEWLRSESRNGEIPLADFNPDITALVHEYQSRGQTMTLEQLADWIFVHKFLPARFNTAPADVFQYLRDLPPTMSSFVIERAQNVVRMSGRTLQTSVKNGLTYGLIAAVAGATIGKVASTPLQNALNGAIDLTEEKLKNFANDPTGAQITNANEALVRTLDAIKVWKVGPASDSTPLFEETQRTTQDHLPIVFAQLKTDLTKKADALSYESKLEDRIKAAQAQMLPTQEALDESMQKIKDQTLQLQKLKAAPPVSLVVVPVDPSAPTIAGLTKSLADEQQKARTLETQLSSIMADWLLDRYLHKPTDAKYPDNKDGAFPEATRVAYAALYQTFLHNDHGVHLSTLVPELDARLDEVTAMVRASSFVDKDKVAKEVGDWP